MGRLLERYAHLVLWLIGAALILLLALATGALRILPDDGTPQLVTLASKLLQWIGQHQVGIELVAKIVGGMATLAGAAYSIVKGIYYARSNLPRRFLEIMKEDNKALVVNRDRARGLIDNSRQDLQINRVSLYVGPLNRALHQLNLGRIDEALKSPDAARAEIETQKSIAAQRLDSLSRQHSTAHILRGVIFCSKARLEKFSDSDRLLQLNSAISEFEAALQVCATDVDALELRAETLLICNRESDARADLERLAHAARERSTLPDEAARMLLVEARANRRLAELEIQRAVRLGIQAAYNDARDWFDAGVLVLEEMRSTLTVEHLLELGRLRYVAAKTFRDQRPQRPALFANAKQEGCRVLKDIKTPEAELLIKELQYLELDG